MNINKIKNILINYTSPTLLKKVLNIEDVMSFLISEHNDDLKNKLFQTFKSKIEQHLQEKFHIPYFMEKISDNNMYVPLKELYINVLKEKCCTYYVDIKDIILIILTSQNIPKEIKDQIYKENERSIYDYILDNIYHCVSPEYLSNNMDDRIKNIVVNKLCNTKILKNEVVKLLNSPDVSEEVKEKLFYCYEEELVKLFFIDIFRSEYLGYDKLLNAIVNKKYNNIQIEDILRTLAQQSLPIDIKEKILNLYENEILSLSLESICDDTNYEKAIDKKIDSIHKSELLEEIVLPIIFLTLEEVEKINTKLYEKRKYEIIELIKSEPIDKIFKLLVSTKLPDRMIDDIFEYREKEIEELLLNNSFDYKNYLYRDSINESNSIISEKVLNKIIEHMTIEEVIETIKKSSSAKIKEKLYSAFEMQIDKWFDNANLTEKDLMIKSLLKNNNLFNTFLKKFNLKKEDVDFINEVIKYYKNNKYVFINSIDKIKSFLNDNNIDQNKFFQYAINSHYDWLNDIISIVENDNIQSFVMVKDYFFTNYFFETENYNNIINNFNMILKNFNKYPELLLSIVNSKRNLTIEEKEQLEFLFTRNDNIFGNNKPTTIEDCQKITEIFSQKCREKFINIDNMSIDEIKNTIALVLFNDTLKNIEMQISIYGGSEELEKLAFNNRNNTILVQDIRFMEALTKLIEEIIFCDDIEKLKTIAKNILINYDDSCKMSYLFTNYYVKMQKLYELDANHNLTKITEDIIDKLKDEEKSKKYGVETFDLSDKEYVILTHIKSEHETIEQIIYGKSSGTYNFISLAPISYRNQVYYTYYGNIIFGYDEIPVGNFVSSSISNMLSNELVAPYSSDVKQRMDRKQRGILETSSATEKENSEILCFRENLIPKYIILPGGREPTEEELKIAKEYRLKFVLTQKVESKINNPKKIETKQKETVEKTNEKLDELYGLINKLMTTSTKKPKKIAILTDVHALYEPTLAILNDATKNGVDEIFSLGDNIGTGPNPRETLELLDRYGVKSVAGNHELYITEGIETFKKHLINTGAHIEAKRNSTWTKNQLTKQQIDKIKIYPKMIELILGGKKILLCHFIKNYNDDKLIVSTENYDQIFQGHIHFKSTNGTVNTLRGAGIGYRGETTGEAYYIIITEKEDGGYTIEERRVPFDIINLEHSINSSEMDPDDKNKIYSWSQAGRRR